MSIVFDIRDCFAKLRRLANYEDLTLGLNLI